MRTKVQNQLLAIGIVFLIGGLALVFLGFSASSKAKDLEARGVAVPAKIVAAAVEKSTKGSNKRYILTVAWGEAQAAQTKKFAVEKAYYDSKVGGDGAIVSGDVTMRQIPGEPDSAMLEGQKYPFSGWQNAGYAVVAVGVLMAFLGIRKKGAARVAG